MRLMIGCMLLVLGTVGVAPRPGWAQVTKAAIGTGVGVAGGAVITMSIVVARARFEGIYLDSADDLIHWQSTPMLLTPAVGMFFGLAGKEPLKGSVIGSTSGLLLGSAIGAGIGWMASASPEAPWAGGVIGAGAGMTIGGLFMGLRAWLRTRDAEEEGDAEPTRIEIRVPL